MISFITWTNNSQEYQRFQRSASLSCIDCDIVSEFIEVDQQARSMAEAYYIGQERAHGDIMVYCHQDIIIHDLLFAEKLTKFFASHPDCGFAGVIGNKRINSGSWWTVGKHDCCGYVRQTDKEKKRADTVFDFGRGTQQARQLDGLLLATSRRWLFPVIQLSGIHFFDLWMCMQAESQGLKNYVIDTDIEHTSWGETDSQHYKKNHEIYKQKWFSRK
jgi:hypothetical protein